MKTVASKKLLILCFAVVLLWVGCSTAFAEEEAHIPLKVSRIKLQPARFTLTVGMRAWLRLDKCVPAETNYADLNIISSNTRVATVDERGFIIAIAPGKATVTLKAKDGKGIAKCAVTVKKMPASSTLNAEKDALLLAQRTSPAAADVSEMHYLPGAPEPKSALGKKLAVYLQNSPALFSPGLNKDLFVGQEDLFSLYCIAYNVLASPYKDSIQKSRVVALDDKSLGLTNEDVAAVRAWMRAEYPNIVFGSPQDLFFANPQYEPGSVGGSWLSVLSIHRPDDTHYAIDCCITTGSMAVSIYRMGIEKLPDGSWKVDAMIQTGMV